MASRRRKTKLPIWATILLLIGMAVFGLAQRTIIPWLTGKGTPTESGGGDQSKNRPNSPSIDTADNALLGFPSPAFADSNHETDFLISKPQYVLSYDSSHGIPNWVSWHVQQSDLGSAERSQFAPDQSLPRDWYRVTPNDYKNSGFDRGHLCPSADRTSTSEDNQATFLMTNIVPQAPDNNQGPWADFENYCRQIVKEGNELYICAGIEKPLKPIPGGKVFYPKALWKVVVVLPDGTDDLNRIGASTRVICIEMPNKDGIRSTDWRKFRISVDDLERKTDLDLLNKVPTAIQDILERRVDSE